MRIVDVCAFYSPSGGGVRTYVDRKLRAARSQGIDLIVVAPGEHAGTEQRSEGQVVTLPGPKLAVDRRYRYFADETALHALLDRLAPDVVEVSSPWASAGMVARWPGPALRALVMHCDPLSAYAYRWFGAIASRATIDRGFDWFWRHLRRLDAEVDLVVSASAGLSRRLVAGGLTKVVTEPMGVEPGIFSPALRDTALRATLLEQCGLGPDATLLIGVGRMAPEKRWPMVIEAVTAAGYERPVGLVLLGEGRDLPRIMRAAGNNPHIAVRAPIRDRADFAHMLASADALVHGCEAETFCMVAAEARASGLPLIVPDEGGAADQCRVGERYRAGSPRALTDAIVRVAGYGRLRERARARSDAAVVPTMDQHFSRLFARYADMTASGAAPILLRSVPS